MKFDHQISWNFKNHIATLKIRNGALNIKKLTLKFEGDFKARKRNFKASKWKFKNFKFSGNL